MVDEVKVVLMCSGVWLIHPYISSTPEAPFYLLNVEITSITTSGSRSDLHSSHSTRGSLV
ncbi:hypothetical protein E2C01_075467 [Portunus trituberculatus]|uniref:Uncharacterized protein n=1 Tax=Portunus trituberculatus TaxID=210409 RepID=A0A5B7IAR9_PORTR|nr:hypothetical protein [Portunus trituberculatus]